jgi:hypothetical protein
MGRLCRIVYCSRSRLSGSRAEIELGIRKILAAARQRNRAARLTGALTFTDSCFAQVLEGDLDDLAPVFTSIRRDPRHTDLKILEQVSPNSRLFPTWSMAFVDTSDDGDGHHPLAHFSFETALTNGAAPEVERVLNALRRVVAVKSKHIAV